MSTRRAKRFQYLGFEASAATGQLKCHYRLDEQGFTETVTFPGTEASEAWESPAARSAALWVHLLSGVSYYKAGAPPSIDLETSSDLSAEDLDFLRRFFVDGLGEFAYRNGLDLSDLVIAAGGSAAAAGGTAAARTTDAGGAGPERPLVPFGGGIDSIVTTELVRRLAGEGEALFVVSKGGDRYAAIEQAAAGAGLPIVRAERSLDPAILRSEERGYLNGHVPVTGIVSAVAVLAAVLHGRDGVIMSNEASASVGNLVSGGRVVNHQWSKSIEFEEGFRSAIAATGVDYFSLLRPASELWVARQFAGLEQYHSTFRSCNKAFFVDPARRLDRWCGECDKCCFVDLILAPFLGRAALEAVFAGPEPLANGTLTENFRVLLALSATPKPWDCVGDTAECRAALRLAAARDDRQQTEPLQKLASELSATTSPGDGTDPPEELSGPHFIPAAYAPSDLLV